MNKEAASIFEASGCPSSRQLIDYLEGRLTPDRAHEVEMHLSDCAFCAEALEGFQQVANKDQIPVIVKQIHGQLRRELESHRSKKRKAKRYVWLSAIILIVLIIVIIAYFAIYFSMKKESAGRHAPAPPAAVTLPASR